MEGAAAPPSGSVPSATGTAATGASTASSASSSVIQVCCHYALRFFVGATSIGLHVALCQGGSFDLASSFGG